MDLDAAGILGDAGLIARRLPTYEHRPQQLEMAEAITSAIETSSHLVVEAGTGVGKSFAYLVPAILAATRRQQAEGQQRRIVISTHTISLQEQLISKDIPFLNAVTPLEFSAVLVKGRSNYLSLRRLQAAAARAPSVFAESEEIDQLRRIQRWAGSTRDGSLSDLDITPAPAVWDEVRSEHGNCLGRKCPTYQDCHYYAARRRARHADLLVVNHALFFADLALRREGASVIPDYDVVVLDEAHTIEAVASEHLGLSVSHGQITYLLNKLYNDRTQRGLLLYHQLEDCQKLVQRLRFLADGFFEQAQVVRARAAANGRVRNPLPIETPLPHDLRQLAGEISTYAAGLDEPTQQVELTSAAQRLLGLSGTLDSWLQQSTEDGVYWIEVSGRLRRNVRLMCAPLDVGPVLRDELFNQVPSVILTSATLAIGAGDFSFFRNRIGLTRADELQLGSPFDYRRQMKLILADNMPDPAGAPREFDRAACERIRHHVLHTAGRAFVLFTSYQMLKACAAALSRWFTEQNLSLFCQGEGMPRSTLLERFREAPRAVLFGTESFWQGVDVPGDALQNVIIVRLPFSVPDHPLLEARMEQIRGQGGNPFIDHQVPSAIIKLRQGFGRLIRSRTDRGQVVILDPRVRSKPYGRLFLNSLPDCKVIIDDGTGDDGTPELS